jgi:carboxyl-terminal processing protease
MGVAVRSALSFALTLLLVACGALPTRPSAGPIADVADDVAAVSTTSLSSPFSTRNARVDVADRAWRVIAGNFYDPKLNGVDWGAVRKATRTRVAAAANDSEFYAALKDMAAALGDSHTMVLTPRETLDRRRFVSTRIGMQITYIDSRVVVSEVEPESPAARAGISVGDILFAAGATRFDGAFIRAALADPRLTHGDVLAGDGPEALPTPASENERVRVLRAVRREMRRTALPGKTGGLTVDVVRTDGALLRAQLVPTPSARPPSAELRWLDGQVAVIRFTRFVPELRQELEAALEEAHKARALIVDLRGNGGGLIEMFRWFTGRFLPEERLVMRSLSRDRVDGRSQNIGEMYVGPDRFDTAARPLLQPLAVLVDGRTGSAAELAAVVLAEQRSALLVGEPTCGCVVGVRFEYVLPDGGGVRVAETGFVSARGARLEGAPTMPAVRVMPTLAELRSGRDPVLEEAHRRVLKAPAR